MSGDVALEQLPRKRAAGAEENADILSAGRTRITLTPGHS